MTVCELLQRMTAAEETHWLALYSIDPWGEQRADMRIGQVAQITYNANSKKPRKLQDFMLFHAKPEDRGDSPETIRKNFDRLIAGQKK